MAVHTPPSWLQQGSHPAIDDRLMMDGLITQPGVTSRDGLKVTQNSTPGMSVFVAAGGCFILGSDISNQGVYHLFNDGTVTVTIAASDPTNPRKDVIVARVQDAAVFGGTNLASVAVVTGTPAGSPVEPALPANTVKLAVINVAAAATQILNASITDSRVFAATQGGVAAVTSTTLPSTPHTGQVVYESDSGKFKVWTGSAWGAITTDVGSASGVIDFSGAGALVPPSQSGYRNRIINGDYSVWQRGTGSFNTSGYTADRWRVDWAAVTSPGVSRQTLTLGTLTDRAAYYLRETHTTASSTTEQAVVQQRIESVATLAGKSATFSFWAKADAARSVSVRLTQNFGTGGSPSASVIVGTTKVTLTTGWVRYTVTFTVPSITGKTLGSNGNDYLGLELWTSCGSTTDATINGQIGTQSGTFDFFGVQVEEGTAATPFEYRPQQIELGLCQRYYQRWQPTQNQLLPLGVGQWITTTVANCVIALPTPMRTAPTGGAASVGSGYLANNAGTAVITAGLTPQTNYHPASAKYQFGVASATGTAGQVTEFGLGSSTAFWLDASAEL